MLIELKFKYEFLFVRKVVRIKHDNLSIQNIRITAPKCQVKLIIDIHARCRDLYVYANSVDSVKMTDLDYLDLTNLL